jgi:hypothetical protein
VAVHDHIVDDEKDVVDLRIAILAFLILQDRLAAVTEDVSVLVGVFEGDEMKTDRLHPCVPNRDQFTRRRDAVVVGVAPQEQSRPHLVAGVQLAVAISAQADRIEFRERNEPMRCFRSVLDGVEFPTNSRPFRLRTGRTIWVAAAKRRKVDSSDIAGDARNGESTLCRPPCQTTGGPGAGVLRFSDALASAISLLGRCDGDDSLSNPFERSRLGSARQLGKRTVNTVAL